MKKLLTPAIFALLTVIVIVADINIWQRELAVACAVGFFAGAITSVFYEVVRFFCSKGGDYSIGRVFPNAARDCIGVITAIVLCLVWYLLIT